MSPVAKSFSPATQEYARSEIRQGEKISGLNTLKSASPSNQVGDPRSVKRRPEPETDEQGTDHVALA
jgi:hypothetical protein